MKTNSDILDFYTIKPAPYDLRTGEKLYLPKVKRTRYDLNSLIFHGSLLLNNLPVSINTKA